MSGKRKCRILKEIRQKIADENDIPYVTQECRYQGECRGTCPKCESELRYLERQLAARAAAGKRIAVAALCAGMVFNTAGCSPLDATSPNKEISDLAGATELPSRGETTVPDEAVTPGNGGEDQVDVTTGEAPEEYELMGDVVYTEENAGNE